MPHISEDRLQELTESHREVVTIRDRLRDVTQLVSAAASCGFVSINQEDALIFALVKLLKEPEHIVRLIIKVPPKGYKFRG